MIKNHEVSPTFAAEDRRAVEAIGRIRDDLARAKSLSPTLCTPLKDEIRAREASLRKAREAAQEHEVESAELARATARHQAARAQYHYSVEVAPAAAREIVLEAETAKYLEAARRRRVEAARSAAASAYSRAAKNIADRNAAVRFAEHFAAAVINAADLPSETRPGVLAWARLTLPAEGRTEYLREYAVRENHASYDRPRPIEAFDRAVENFWSSVAREREKAAKLAAELGALEGGSSA